MDSKVPFGLEIGTEKKFKCAIGVTLTPTQKKPTIIKKGRDGKKYSVFSQISLNEATRKLHPEAFCREYWMPDESHPYFYILDRNGERLSEDLYAELASGEVDLVANCK